MSITQVRARRPRAYLAAAVALLALCLSHAAAASAQQWQSTGNDISSTNSGNVGIGTGTSAPAYKLDVRGALSAQSGVFKGDGVSSGSNFQFWKDAAASYAANIGMTVPGGALTNDLIFTRYTSGSGWFEAMRIRGDTGRVGIGTDSPQSGLHVHSATWSQSVRVSGAGGAYLNLVDTAAVANQRFFQWSSAGGSFRLSLVNDSELAYAQQNILVANPAGNVGLGTGGPNERLQVQGAIRLDAAAGGQPYTLLAQAPGGLGGSVLANNADSSGKYVTGAVAVAANLAGGVFTVNTAPAGAAGNNITWNERLRVDSSGNVGIGTQTPAAGAKLDVAGNVNVSAGNITVTGDISATGNIAAKYQDMAEWVPSSKLLPAGTVVVLDASHNNQVTSSSKSYDTRVAGVVSPQPGITLGERGEGKALVATTGRVKVKVDASKAPIAVGDLLVTSDVEGVAMKSIPIDLGGVAIHRPGTIIGKALEPLEKGTGEILVLLSLQ